MATQRRFVDLHTHSIASDGTISPAQLVDEADRLQLAAIALTDHDTTEGIDAARRQAEQYPDLQFVAGIEISAVFPGGTLHILGLGIDETAPGLVEMTQYLRNCREARNPKILEKLQALGMPVSMDEVLAVVPGTHEASRRVVSRTHIAKVMQRKGFARTFQEVFDKYLGTGAIAHVDKERIEPSKAIAAIRDAGGVALVAHPPQLKTENTAQLERVLRSLMAGGLGGIEVYHSDHSDFQTRLYLDLAKQLGLLTSGGSDFHGPGKPHVLLGRPRVPASVMAPAFLPTHLR